MANDSLEEALSRPLKRRQRVSLAPFLPWFVRIGGGIVLTVLAGALLWILAVSDPFGGEPTAEIALTVAPSSSPHPQQDMPSTVVPPRSSAPQSGPAQRPVTPGGALVIQPQTTTTVRRGLAQFAPDGSLPSSFDPSLVEKVGDFFIPVPSGNGVRALDAYARPTDLEGVAGRLPRIAIVVTGLGMSQTTTQEALRVLPRETTLAFAPYGGSLDRWGQRARQEGFEYLVQVPMEPFDYPDSDPGPHTLLISNDIEANMARLHWAMARMPTPVGMMNYMGARFTASDDAFRPIMADVVDRGLLFLDDGTSARSRVRDVAGAGQPVLRGDITVDVTPEKAAIEMRLLQLESIARERGVAIGIASALPITLQALNDWAEELRTRGFLLVPLSVMATHAANN